MDRGARAAFAQAQFSPPSPKTAFFVCFGAPLNVASFPSMRKRGERAFFAGFHALLTHSKLKLRSAGSSLLTHAALILQAARSAGLRRPSQRMLFSP